MGNEMYFIVKGVCEVIANNSNDPSGPEIISTKVRSALRIAKNKYDYRSPESILGK